MPRAPSAAHSPAITRETKTTKLTETETPRQKQQTAMHLHCRPSHKTNHTPPIKHRHTHRQTDLSAQTTHTQTIHTLIIYHPSHKTRLHTTPITTTHRLPFKLKIKPKIKIKIKVISNHKEQHNLLLNHKCTHAVCAKATAALLSSADLTCSNNKRDPRG